MEWKVENWKPEEYVLMNMNKKTVFGQGSPRFRNGNKIYEIEDTLKAQEKLDIIDNMYDGLGSLIYNFIKKWDVEKTKVKLNEFGGMKKNSQVSVLKKIYPETQILSKNLKKYVRLDLEYKVGSYSMFGGSHKKLSLKTGSTEYSYEMEHTDKNIVHQWFHDMLKKLEEEERKHYKENDPVTLKIEEVKQYANYLGQFEGKDINDIVWNSKKDVSEEYLDKVLDAYKKLEKYKEYLERKILN